MTWKARQAWDARKAWWLETTTAVAVVVIVIVCVSNVWTAPLLLAPLLAVPPALAGVGARSYLRPLAYGAVSLVAAIVIAVTASGDTHEVPVATIVAIVVMTAISAAATAFSGGRPSSSPTSSRSRRPPSGRCSSRCPASSARSSSA